MSAAPTPSEGRGLTVAAASWWRPAVVVSASLAFAVGYGFNFGLGNQNAYLLAGLRLGDPAFLEADWFATQTTSYHQAFTFLAHVVLEVDASGWVLALVNTLLIFVGGLAVFGIVRCLARRALRIPVFLLVLACATATETFSAGESYLYWRILQPSTLGATGLLVAFYFFLRRRYLLSGLALAVGGAFHANYLVLGVPTLVVAHLLLRREHLGARLARQLVLPVVALVPLLPLILLSAGADGADAVLVFLTVRAPHHYVPLHFWRECLPLLAWVVLLLVSLPRVATAWRRPSAGAALVSSLLLLIGLGALLTTVVYLPRVAQAYVWRFAPVLVLLAQVYTARSLVRSLEGQPYDGNVRPGGARIALVLLAAALLAFQYEDVGNRQMVFLVTASLVAWTATRVARRWMLADARRGRALAGVLAGVLFVSVVAPPLRDVEGRSNLLATETAPASALFAWARTTEPTSRFLVPPDFQDFQGFRLATGRAIVADWKACPLLADEVREWYARMTAVCGGTPPTSLDDARRLYEDLAPANFEEVVERYDVDYAVTRARAPGQPPKAWPVVFETESFRVRASPKDR